MGSIGWKAFSVSSIFTKIERGKRLKKADHIIGETPYVSSTALNNGVDAFIKAVSGTRVFNNCISLANSGSVGAAFYEPFDFVASDHVTHLKNEGFSEDIYLMLSLVLKKQGVNFNFNREINDNRISKMQVMLPIKDDGTPDWEYISHYVSNKKTELFLRYKKLAEERVLELHHKDIPGLDEIEWKPFFIQDIFDVIMPGQGKGLNHLTKVETGGIPYIGATNRNNGVMCLVELNDFSKKMVQPGNCIGFIKNGDGSAGYAIYKESAFISTNDVIYGWREGLNRYIGLFFVVAQDMIEEKYSHGYKRNQEHLKRDRVMLPSTAGGQPDWEYMEQYVKNLMRKKYQQYLQYIKDNKG